MVSSGPESDVAFGATRLDSRDDRTVPWVLALGLGLAIGAGSSFAHAGGYVNLAAPFEGILVPAPLGPGPKPEIRSKRMNGPLFVSGPRVQLGRAVPNVIRAEDLDRFPVERAVARRE
jgi:hypothetical protein